MKMNRHHVVCIATAIFPVMVGVTTFQTVQAAPPGYVNPETTRVVEYWTKGRRAKAIPRDLVIDPRGLGYLRKPDGLLQPYGHDITADVQSQQPKPFAKPSAGSSGDSMPPTITNMDPKGSTIGASYTFSATVSDDSGIKSVSFVIQYPNGLTQSFNPSASGDTWSIGLSGFTDGDWAWQVVAKDQAGRGGNTATKTANFTVSTSGGGGGSGSGETSSDTVTNAKWSSGGAVQNAAGRLYFEMPSNAKWKGPWTGYVCSGTVVNDAMTDRSIILTASHCVYDDANKAFARNVMFIPDQAETLGTGTDLNCNNDPLGCWVPSFGVVHVKWTMGTFPANIPWDYAYYVVNDAGAHLGQGANLQILDKEAGALPIKFDEPAHDDGIPGANSSDFTYALGYSYSNDPNFMYCAEDMTSETSYSDWWLPSCGLSGGSSGGPWVQSMATSTGTGDVISVNSWGYTNSPGMAGPPLNSTSAQCVFNGAKNADFSNVSSEDGKAGVMEDCP